VFEHENPSLKSLPLGVKQKSILATCNYVARARGVKKLMLISEAQKICPELVLMNGEDLSRFRDVSKRLWAFLRSHSWNNRVERLGLDEVFLDVSDLISYNLEVLNPNALKGSFFQLSRQDPEKGFKFDANAFFGCVYTSESSSEDTTLENPLFTRLLLASHLAGYLRHKLEEDFGYTSTCGVSTNKLLAKLAGTRNKPKNQTTLISIRDESVQQVSSCSFHSLFRSVRRASIGNTQSSEEMTENFRYTPNTGKQSNS
jgi:DNA polymerase iota